MLNVVESSSYRGPILFSSIINQVFARRHGTTSHQHTASWRGSTANDEAMPQKVKCLFQTFKSWEYLGTMGGYNKYEYNFGKCFGSLKSTIRK